ncbi:MAG: hypothetical protein Q8L98_05715 [Chlamydiales bacterium]|nr:hypothetical protein [Chlamydiales bacterium]
MKIIFHTIHMPPEEYTPPPPEGVINGFPVSAIKSSEEFSHPAKGMQPPFPQNAQVVSGLGLTTIIEGASFEQPLNEPSRHVTLGFQGILRPDSEEMLPF